MTQRDENIMILIPRDSASLALAILIQEHERDEQNAIPGSIKWHRGVLIDGIKEALAR